MQLFKTYITCTSNPELNPSFRSNEVLLLDSHSAWNASGEILEETAEILKNKVQENTILYFDIHVFIDAHDLMIVSQGKIDYKKTVVHKQYGDWNIPKDSILQNVFPTEVHLDYTLDVETKAEIEGGKFPV